MESGVQMLVRDTGEVFHAPEDLVGTHEAASIIGVRPPNFVYVDIAMLLRAGNRLADVIGYAAADFDRQFVFPVHVFVRSLVWFRDGTAVDVPADIRGELEEAVHDLDLADIPLVHPYRATIPRLTSMRPLDLS